MRVTRFPGLVLSLLTGTGLFLSPVHAGLGQQAVSATGVEGGLFVQVGVTEASALLEAAQGNRFMVHGLAADLGALASVRAAVMAQNRYGQVSAEKVSGFAALPYGENLVNLLLADLDQLGPQGLTEKEIDRVLAPGGASYVKKGGTWSVKKKGRPDQYGTWSHFFANSENTQASDDRALGITTAVKWTANHQWGASGGSTYSSTHMRVGTHTVFYTFPRQQNQAPILVARDAYNGITLWSKDMTGTDFGDNDVRWRFVTDGEDLFYFESFGGAAVRVNGRTGQIVRTYADGLKLTKKTGVRAPGTSLTVCNGKLIQADGSDLVVLDIESGQVKFRYKAPNNLWIMRVGASKEENKAFFAEAGAPFFMGHDNNLIHERWPMVDDVRALTVMDLNGSGTPSVRKELEKFPAYDGCLVNDMQGPYAATYPRIQQLTYHKGRLILFGNEYADPSFLIVFDMTGKELWRYTWIPNERWKNATVTYQMIVKGDSIYAGSGAAMLAFNLSDGKTAMGNVNLARTQPCPVADIWFDARHNGRCTRPTANQNWLLMGFGMFVDGGRNWSFVNATRSSCGQGGHIGNGMVYYTTHNCGCLGRSLSNFQALRFEQPPAPLADNLRKTETPQLPPKAALTQTPAPLGELAKDWTVDWNNSTYYNLETICTPRGGGPGIGNPSVCVEGKKGPIPVGGYQFTVALNEHRLECRNASGLLWSFVADGRISKLPILVGDLAVFGSHDGYVYAVKASDGTPAWRFLAAPNVKKMVAYGQLESHWPVFGVTYENGSIAFSAGRHPTIDGGIFAYGLDPATGALKWRKVARADLMQYAYTNRPAGDVKNTVFNTDSLAKTGFNPANPQDILVKTVNNTGAGTAVLSLPPVAVGVKRDLRNSRMADKTGKLGFLPIGYQGDAYVFQVFSPSNHQLALYGAEGKMVFKTESQGNTTYEIGSRMLPKGRYVGRITDKAGRSATFKLTLSD